MCSCYWREKLEFPKSKYKITHFFSTTKTITIKLKLQTTQRMNNNSQNLLKVHLEIFRRVQKFMFLSMSYLYGPTKPFFFYGFLWQSEYPNSPSISKSWTNTKSNISYQYKYLAFYLYFFFFQKGGLSKCNEFSHLN